ncbi:MAG: hypothetical protein P8I93_05290 [Crocinitomicaceae bacterium]|nr:hypothetical protein [Crocinitomicaceae bacterium]
MRKAIIDLGTNTFNLLIAEFSNDNWHVVFNQKIGVLLGMGGINSKTITKDAMARGIHAMKKFNHICNKYQTKPIAIGTSAIRDATNKKVFVESVFKETGIKIEVISGDKEAEYIYKGVKKTFLQDSGVIMDIGGGSTEIIYFKNKKIIKKKSFDIGVSRIYQMFDFQDPISKREAEELKDWFDQQTDGFLNDINCNTLIGASGSFETLYELIHKKHFQSNTSIQLPFDHLTNTLNLTSFSSYKERNENDWIVPIRKKMIPFAAIKVQWLIEQLNIKKVYVSPYSMKEGFL